ncbi:MAG: metal-dependent transcriptional regulator [Chloroflexi bacterium]|nr:metal-dependent transcriptional regulator [Chloroflexota bacterium]
MYLAEALGFGWDEVHEQADLLEHVISEKLEERIAAALGHPEFDPHGDPIPARDGTITDRKTRPLTAVSPGESAVIARILDDDDSERLRYLGNWGYGRASNSA